MSDGRRVFLVDERGQAALAAADRSSDVGGEVRAMRTAPRAETGGGRSAVIEPEIRWGRVERRGGGRDL